MKSVSNSLLSGYGSRTLTRARDYVRQGRVFEINADADAQRLTAWVRGTRAQPYETEVDWSSGYADGMCTCPVEYDCKHAAAAVMAFFSSGSYAARGLAVPERIATPQPALDRTELALVQWLEALDTLGKPVVQRTHSASKEGVVYLLDIKTWPGLPVLRVTVRKGRRRKNGTYGSVSQYDPRRAVLGDPGKFVHHSDLDIFYRLMQVEHDIAPSNQYLLSRNESTNLLPLLLETGRCFWQNADSPALKQGEERQGHWRWELDESGEQALVLATDSAAMALPVAPPWYMDVEQRTCGLLHTDVSNEIARVLLQAPKLNPERVSRIKDQLAVALPNHLPQPQAVETNTRNNVKPISVLRLGMARSNVPVWYGTMAGAWAQLAFDYDGSEVNAADSRLHIDRVADGRLLRIERDLNTEIHASEVLDEFILCNLGINDLPEGAVTLGNEEEDWLAFVGQSLPKLVREGWRVEVASEFPIQGLSAQNFEIDIQDGEDWFGVGLGIEINGERRDLLPILLKAIEAMPPMLRTPDALDDASIFHLPLDGKRSLAISVERIKPILRVLVELFDKPTLNDDGRLRVNRLDAVRLNELDSIKGVDWRGSKSLKALADKLRNFTEIKRVAVPKTFHGQLRDYQKEGLNWLQFLRRYDFGGVLADDMGLGKTVQTLAHLLVEKKAGRSDRPNLLVAPTSLLHNWQAEANRFAPSLRVLILHGAERHDKFEHISDYDLVVTTYPLLPRDSTVLKEQPWHYVILDEAQVIKNPRTKAAREACGLDAHHRLCLTGTPMENHLGELWSLFRFLMPGFLGDTKQFQRLYRTPIEKHHDLERREHLNRRVRPFLLRRTKDVVATELPPKTEMVQSIEIDGAQRDLYESVRLTMHKKVRDTVKQKGFARSQIEILEALLKLRQVCCDPRLLKSGQTRQNAPSAKLKRLEELLPALLEEGRRVLLFSQFTEMLGLIESMVERHGIAYSKLTGRTRKRAEVIERFQSGAVPLLLISLKAGGVGLNLTSADTVIHYDPWWNPAVESQATDRAHRIGQDKPVFVYKLICTGTVEEQIQKMQARKQALLQSIYTQNQNQSAAFNHDDLEALLKPVD